MDGMHGGSDRGLALSNAHTHKPPHCVSKAVTKQSREKGPYLPEPPLRKEQGISTTFLFFSFYCPFTPLCTPQPWSPHCRRGQKPGERGEVKGGGVGGSWRGTYLIRGWMIFFNVAWGGEKGDDELLLLQKINLFFPKYFIVTYKLSWHIF